MKAPSGVLLSCQIAWQCPFNRDRWLRSPENIKEADKQAKIICRKALDPARLLFYAHRLCMNYIINASIGCLQDFVQGQPSNKASKNITENFARFHNHSLHSLHVLIECSVERPNIRLNLGSHIRWGVLNEKSGVDVPVTDVEEVSGGPSAYPLYFG